MNGPIVRLTLEHMKAEMLHWFDNFQATHSDELQAALDKAFAEFDFEAEIKAIMIPLVRDRLRQAIDGAISDVLYSSGGRELLAKMALRGLHARLRKAKR